jgi:hypothetical protein
MSKVVHGQKLAAYTEKNHFLRIFKKIVIFHVFFKRPSCPASPFDLAKKSDNLFKSINVIFLLLFWLNQVSQCRKENIEIFPRSKIR